jgi:hypothetical protein
MRQARFQGVDAAGTILPADDAYDPRIVRQHQALALYIRQCHGERELAEIPPTSETR